MCTLDIIKQLLKKQKKTQLELCQYIGVSKQAFTEWNGGRNTSYKKYLPQIADFFGVSVDYLLGKEDKKEKSPSGIPDRLWEILSKDPVKMELALWIAELDSDRLERVAALLNASLLRPSEDSQK